VLMDQTWLGLSGGFAPTSLPLFHGGRCTVFGLSGTRVPLLCLLSRDRAECPPCDPERAADDWFSATSSVG
jgi:hypothetical protein